MGIVMSMGNEAEPQCSRDYAEMSASTSGELAFDLQPAVSVRIYSVESLWSQA